MYFTKNMVTGKKIYVYPRLKFSFLNTSNLIICVDFVILWLSLCEGSCKVYYYSLEWIAAEDLLPSTETQKMKRKGHLYSIFVSRMLPEKYASVFPHLFAFVTNYFIHYSWMFYIVKHCLVENIIRFFHSEVQYHHSNTLFISSFICIY